MHFRRWLSGILFVALLFTVVSIPETAQAASAYYIEVDITNQYVTVYRTSDGAIVRQMICSTGASSTPTPTGTYTMPNKKYSSERKEWYSFSSSYGKYASRIVGGILFHSYLFSSKRDSAVIQSSVQKLGSQASHGCIRLRIADAKWIAYNCPPGTRVKIYKSGKRNNTLRALLLSETYSIDDGLSYAAYTGISTDPNTYGRGKTGEEVKDLQLLLQGLGFYTGSADGVYGTATLEAVRAFQIAAGLNATGLADPETREAVAREDAPVGNRTTLAEGMSGPAIIALQKSLTALKIYTGEIDGIYDAEVAQAVKMLQRVNSAADDGKANTALQTYAAAQAAALIGEYGENPYGAIYIEESVSIATVKVSSALSLRKTASTSAKILAKLKNGTQVTVLAKGSSWSRVQYGSTVGYLKNSYLRFSTRKTASLVYGEGFLSTAEDILALQENLISLGYYDGEATGVYDTKTMQAVKAFQEAAGLEASGYAGNDTQTAIIDENAPTGTGVTFRENMSGKAVKKLQQALYTLKLYADVDFDGIYDAAVVDAVKAFQGIYGYTVDGNATGALQSDAIARASELNQRFGESEYGMIYFTEETAMATVKVSSSLTLRKSASTSSKKLGTLKNGARVVVLSKGKTWSKVQYGTTVGYLKNSYLKFYTQKNTVLEYGEGYLTSAAEITALQENLISLGYLAGPATGIYDRATLNAVSAFQKAAGLEATGYANAETQSAVRSDSAPVSTSSTLSEGSCGKAVKQLQTGLATLKLYEGEIDGVFDSALTDAVKKFQRIYRYDENGKANSEIQASVLEKAAELLARFGDSDYEATYGEEVIPMARVKVSSSLSLRKSASTGSKRLAKLKNGTEVIVLQKGSKWSYVQYGTTNGYLMNQYLKFFTVTRVTFAYNEVPPEEGLLGDALLSPETSLDPNASVSPSPEASVDPTDTPTPETPANPTDTPTPETPADPTDAPTPETPANPTDMPTPEASVNPTDMPTPEASANPTDAPTPETLAESTDMPSPDDLAA